MILIVADTGPINYLIQIDCVNLLAGLVTTAVLPSSMLRELRSDGASPQVRSWAANPPDWVEIKNTTTLIPSHTELSLADREAISLAKEMQALLLMDDRRARIAASEVSVTTIGTLGILKAASAKGLVSLPVALERLRATNMYIAEELLSQALQRDSERRRD